MVSVPELKMRAVDQALQEHVYMLVQVDLDIKMVESQQIIIPGAENDRNKAAMALAQFMNKKNIIIKAVKRLEELRNEYSDELLAAKKDDNADIKN